MAKVLVLYYSAYGHVETLANAIADGARSAGAQVDIKRVPETVPEAIAKASHYKLDQAAPVAQVADLEHYDAIVVGTGTRFGRMSSQMAAFLDQAGGLWMKGALDYRSPINFIPDVEINPSRGISAPQTGFCRVETRRMNRRLTLSTLSFTKESIMNAKLSKQLIATIAFAAIS